MSRLIRWPVAQRPTSRGVPRPVRLPPAPPPEPPATRVRDVIMRGVVVRHR